MFLRLSCRVKGGNLKEEQNAKRMDPTVNVNVNVNVNVRTIREKTIYVHARWERQNVRKEEKRARKKKETERGKKRKRFDKCVSVIHDPRDEMCTCQTC